MAQRQIVGYGPNGPVYADPAFGGTPPPADFAFGGSPSAIMPAAQSMPDAMNTPWQTQGPLGGPPPGAPGATGAGNANVNPLNAGAGGGGNALGLVPNAYGMAMSDPGLLSATYNMQSGQNPNGGTYALNDQYGSNLPYVYAMLNGRNLLGSSPDQYFNFANNYLQQGGTQGGAQISSGQVMQALFSEDPQNPVYNMIYGVDASGNAPTPDKIVSRFVNVMQAGMANSAPPFVIQSMTSLYTQAGKEWEVLKMQGKYQGTLTQYLREQGLDPASLGMGG